MYRHILAFFFSCFTLAIYLDSFEPLLCNLPIETSLSSIVGPHLSAPLVLRLSHAYTTRYLVLWLAYQALWHSKKKREENL